MKRLAIFASLIFLLAMAPLGDAQAASAPPTDNEKGLSISPLRQFPDVNAGSTQSESFKVTNTTDKNLLVTFSVKQFSVANYTYNYTFGNPGNNWLQFAFHETLLAPGQTQNISYGVDIPKGAPPGGQYYTLLASAVLSSGSLRSTVQAAVLVYLTVNGKLIKTSSLQASSIQHISFGRQINYTLDPIDTGNVYYYIFVNGQLHGLFTKNTNPPVTHILLPNVVRRVTNTIPAPVLPGIYRATYGYETDAGATTTRSSYVVIIPPWFIALLIVLLLVGNRYLPRLVKILKSKKKVRPNP